MNKTTRKMGAGLLAFAALLSAGSAFAYQGQAGVAGPNYDPDRRAAIEAALESRNYSLWVASLPENARIKEFITADKFYRFVEARNLMLQGDKEAALRIREELGLPLGKGKRIQSASENTQMKQFRHSGNAQSCRMAQ